MLLLFLTCCGKEFKKDEARSRVRCTVSEALYPVSTTFCEAAKKMCFDKKKGPMIKMEKKISTVLIGVRITGIPRFTLLMWRHNRKIAEAKTA